MARRFGCDAVLFYLLQNTGTHLRERFADGNVGDPATIPAQVAKLKERFKQWSSVQKFL